jgi:hypothetical protein
VPSPKPFSAGITGAFQATLCSITASSSTLKNPLWDLLVMLGSASTLSRSQTESCKGVTVLLAKEAVSSFHLSGSVSCARIPLADVEAKEPSSLQARGPTDIPKLCPAAVVDCTAETIPTPS